MPKIDLSAQNIPIVPETVAPPAPKDEDFKGVYKHNADGFLYELAVIPNDPNDPQLKTHTLRVPAQKSTDAKGVVTITHPGLTWHGTKQEFKNTFEKV